MVQQKTISVLSVAESNGRGSNVAHEPNMCTRICSRTEIAGRGNSQQLPGSSLFISSDIFRFSSGPRSHYLHSTHACTVLPLRFLFVWCSPWDCRSWVFLDKALKSPQDVTAVYLCLCARVCMSLFGSRMCVDDRFYFFFHLPPCPLVSVYVPFIFTDKLMLQI